MDKVKETLTKLLGTVKTKWTSADKKVRIAIIAVASVIIVSLIILIILNSTTRYSVLYSGASAEESAEIISVLQSELGETDVKFDGSGNILVPANKVETLRAQLSVKGYPKSTFNYDIWDSGIGMFSTESDKRVKEKQQLQENLRATLAMYDGVDSAIVILTIPDSNDYVISNTKEEAGASVVLQLSHSLSADSINGIYNLIRTAVPGLKEENITVTDNTGTALTTDKVTGTLEAEDETKLFYKRLSFQQEITSILNDKLGRLFEGVFEDYRIGVDVRLNYDSEVSQIKEYTPSVDEEGNRGGMVENEKYVSAGGGNAAEGGLVGTTVDSDISPDYPTLQIGEGDEFYYETQKEINYLVNEAIKQVEKDGYSYDNISASVLVDATDVTQAEVEDWQKLIATAIGTSVDKVTFKASPFPPGRTIGGGSGSDSSVVIQGGRNTLVFIIIALGAILIILIIVALTAAGSSKRRAKARRAAAAAMADTPHGATHTEYGADPTYGGMGGAYSPTGGGPMPGDADFEVQSLSGPENENSRDAVLKKEIREFSKTNPEIVAQLIRTWMKSEE
ncbi:MAG: flagellar basal-body MS-ring/collar protein FliF [Ruminiclostridium sp.]